MVLLNKANLYYSHHLQKFLRFLRFLRDIKNNGQCSMLNVQWNKSESSVFTKRPAGIT